MSNDGKAPDPFGISGEGAPAGGPAPADDPYAALEQAAKQGVAVQQPDAGYDDIFGGAAAAPGPAPTSGLETDPPPPGPAAHDHIPMPDPMNDPMAGGQPGMGQQGMGPPPGRDMPGRPVPQKSNGAFKLITAIAVVVIVGGLGFFLVSGQPPKRDGDTPKPVESSAVENDLAKALAERPPNAPVCWTTNDGFQFSYKTSSGDEKIVDKIQDVPKLYRAGAACKKL